MKNKMIFGVSFVCVFLLGFITCFVFNTPKTEEKPSLIDPKLLNILEEENSYFDSEVERFTFADLDSTSNENYLIRKADTVLTYFKKILSSTKQYDKFSINDIRKIIKTDINLDDFNKNVSNIDFDKYSVSEKRLFINLCKNAIISRYLKKFKFDFLMVNYSNCIVVSENDTLNMGDEYKGKIYFAVTDMSTKENQIKMDNGIKVKDGIYREKATKRGWNKRKGLYTWENFSWAKFYQIEFSYYVK